MPDKGPLEDMSPDDSAAIGAQRPVAQAALRFLHYVVETQDLRSAWPHMHPLLRVCWTQNWLHANRDALEADGYTVAELVEALAADEPEHDLWPHLERVWVRAVTGQAHAAIGADPDSWGVGTKARVVSLDTEVAAVMDTRQLPDGALVRGAPAIAFNLLMRYENGEWLVLNLDSEQEPVPGWPPVLAG